MTAIRGFYYQQGSSAREPCTLQVERHGIVSLFDANGDHLRDASWQDLDISSRLGNTPRFLTFPDGLRIESQENDTIDHLLSTYAPQSRSNWLHVLESNKRFVLLTLVVVIAFVWSMVRYGAPAIADVGSRMVPDEVVALIGEQSLASLDKFYFTSSKLPQDVQDRVITHFRPLMAEHSHLDLRVIFRSSKGESPNAFALPDGTLVFTDAMVRIAKNDDELLAIAAHEVGHVEFRHGMRHMIQSSILAFMLATIVGDISGTSEVFLGIPVMLTELSYSRKFEREADRYAVKWLQKHKKSPLLFANIMERMENMIVCGDEQKDCKSLEDESTKWLDYFSTHPPTDERITRAINGEGT